MTWKTDTELACLRDLVLPAGAQLLEYLGRSGPVRSKGATELVTELDRRTEDLLIEGLGRRFPGDGIVAEESGLTSGQSGRTWYIDPLDGTTNYAHGHPFFCISLGLVQEGVLQAGVVYAPKLDELFLAGRGLGAWLQQPSQGTERVLPRRQPVTLDRALLATGFPYVRNEDVDRNVGLVRDFLKFPCHGVRRDGSAALDLAHVAAGMLDGYWELNLRPWDSAAGILIAREAGALVTDFAGAEVPLPYEEVLAAAPGLHGQMVELIGKHPVQGGGG